MGYGSLATSNVKLVISAQDNASGVLAGVKKAVETISKQSKSGGLFSERALADMDAAKQKTLANLEAQKELLKVRLQDENITQKQINEISRQFYLIENHIKKLRQLTSQSILEKQSKALEAVSKSLTGITSKVDSIQKKPFFGEKALASIDAAKQKILNLYELEKKNAYESYLRLSRKELGNGIPYGAGGSNPKSLLSKGAYNGNMALAMKHFDMYQHFKKMQEANISSQSTKFKLAMLKAGESIVKASQEIVKGANHIKSSWGTWKNNVNKFAQKMKSKGGEFMNMSTVGGTLAGFASLRGLAKPLTDYGDFQRNMLTVQAKSQASAGEYDMLSARAREYAASTSWDPQQVSSVMLEMASAGFKPNEIMNSFAHIMDYSRAVGQDDPMWAARGITSTLRSFKIDTSDSKEVKKAIDKMAAVIVNSPLREDTLREALRQVAPMVLDKGGTLDDALAWIMSMAEKGFDGSNAGTALKNYLVRTGAKSEFMQQFGISVYDENGNRKSSSQLLSDINTARDSMTDMQRDAFDKEVFGMRSAAGINSMFDIKSVEKAYTVLQNASGLSEDIRAHMESGVFGSIKRIFSAMQDMFLEVGKSLETMLKRYEQPIIEWFKYITEEVGDNPRFVQWFTEILIKVTEISAIILSIGAVINTIGAAATGFSGTMTLIAVTTKVIVTFATAIITAFTAVAAVVGTVTAAALAVVAVLGIWIASGMRFTKTLFAIFNGGKISEGIALMVKDYDVNFRIVMTKIISFIWNVFRELGQGIYWVFAKIVSSIIYLLSYIPGLGGLDEVSKSVMDSADFTKWDESYKKSHEKNMERLYKERANVHKQIDTFAKEAAATNTAKSIDAPSRANVPKSIPSPETDLAYIDDIDQRLERNYIEWEKYVRPKSPFMVMPTDVEKQEKIINKYRKAEMKLASERAKAAEETRKAAENEAKAKKKKQENELKKQQDEAKKLAAEKAKKEKEEKVKIEKERKRKEEEVKKQRDLTSGLRSFFKGTISAWEQYKKNQQNLKDIIDKKNNGKKDPEEEQVKLLTDIRDYIVDGEPAVEGV